MQSVLVLLLTTPRWMLSAYTSGLQNKSANLPMLWHIFRGDSTCLHIHDCTLMCHRRLFQAAQSSLS